MTKDEHQKNVNPFFTTDHRHDAFEKGFEAGVKFSEHVNTIIATLHPDSQKLLNDCFVIIAEKMVGTQNKRGFTNEWLKDDWQTECTAQLIRHIEKGDPRDVMIYAMFMTFRNWPTELPDGICLMDCESCGQPFEMQTMIDGVDGQQFCNACYTELSKCPDFMENPECSECGLTGGHYIDCKHFSVDE